MLNPKNLLTNILPSDAEFNSPSRRVYAPNSSLLTPVAPLHHFQRQLLPLGHGEASVLALPRCPHRCVDPSACCGPACSPIQFALAVLNFTLLRGWFTIDERGLTARGVEYVGGNVAEEDAVGWVFVYNNAIIVSSEDWAYTAVRLEPKPTYRRHRELFF